MPARIYPIFEAPGKLSIMRRPPAGAVSDTLTEIANAGYHHVVCCLEADEMAALGLSDEAHICAQAGLVFHPFPIADHDVPASAAATADLVGEILSFCVRGEGVAIHCKASIGRSGLIAAACLVARGEAPDAAFVAVEHARHVRLPDPHPQRSWLGKNAKLFRLRSDGTA